MNINRLGAFQEGTLMSQNELDDETEQLLGERKVARDSQMDHLSLAASMEASQPASNAAKKRPSRKRRRQEGDSAKEINDYSSIQNTTRTIQVPAATRELASESSSGENSGAVLSATGNFLDGYQLLANLPNRFLPLRGGSAAAIGSDINLADVAIENQFARFAASIQNAQGVYANHLHHMGGPSQIQARHIIMNRLSAPSLMAQNPLASLFAQQARSERLQALPRGVSLNNQLLAPQSSQPSLPVSLERLSQLSASVQPVSAFTYNPVASLASSTFAELSRPSPASSQNDNTAVATNTSTSLNHTPSLPPIEDGRTAPYNQRELMPLAIDEDQNWLSEYHCFVRSKLIEVFRADRRDVSDRKSSKSVSFQQVGIRCRYCAHFDKDSRASRSSAFPFSIQQVYQSFTMVLRDHFEKCTAVPKSLKSEFLKLKCKTSMGAANAKSYWEYSAAKLGMVDSVNGITMDETTRAAALRKQPFGSSPEQESECIAAPQAFVKEEDRALASGYIYNLLSQAQRIYLLPSERIGCRKSKSFRVGLPGFGCRYCCQAGRLGLSRVFPVARRTLPAKVTDFETHIRRCTLCPAKVKEILQLQKPEQPWTTADESKEFFDRIWERLGHEGGDEEI